MNSGILNQIILGIPVNQYLRKQHAVLCESNCAVSKSLHQKEQLCQL